MPELERALEPHRLGVVVAEAVVVADERLRRLGAELALLLGVAEPAAPPAGLEQVEHASAAPPHSAAWKRSSTWWTRIPKRWLSVGSLGIRNTRANLYLSGHVR